MRSNWDRNFPRLSVPIYPIKVFFRNISNISILMMVPVTGHHTVFTSTLVSSVRNQMFLQVASTC